MGTTLTGTTPQDTYDSLIKVTDNGPLSGTAKYLSDGLGNDSKLALSTGNIGIGTDAPTNLLTVNSATDSYAEIKTTGLSGDALLGFSNTGDANSAWGIGRRNTGEFWIANYTDNFNSGTRTVPFQIASTGIVEISSGIKFPATQVPSADPNTLDDYEEGTWTVGASFGGASVGIVTFANLGTYTKIGRQVTVNGRISFTNKGSSTGLAAITGLPFTVANTEGNWSSASFRFNRITFATQMQSLAVPNTTTFVFTQTNGVTGVSADLTDANFANNTEIQFSLTYFTA